MAVDGIDGSHRGKRKEGEECVSKHQIRHGRAWRLSGMARDRTAEPVSRSQIIRRERGQGFPPLLYSSADRKQDWQPEQPTVDSQSAEDDDFTISK